MRFRSTYYSCLRHVNTIRNVSLAIAFRKVILRPTVPSIYLRINLKQVEKGIADFFIRVRRTAMILFASVLW